MIKVDFSRPVVPHDPHLLVPGEQIAEITQDHALSEPFAEVFHLEDFLADVRLLHVQLHRSLATPRMSLLFDVQERVDPVFRLSRPGRRGAPDPL